MQEFSHRVTRIVKKMGHLPETTRASAAKMTIAVQITLTDHSAARFAKASTLCISYIERVPKILTDIVRVVPLCFPECYLFVFPEYYYSRCIV